MMTARKSDSAFVLDVKPVGVAVFLAGFIFVWCYIGIQILKDGDNAGWVFLCGLIIPMFILTMVERTTLVLDRRDSSLRLTRRTIYKKRVIVEELEAVSKAKTQWSGRGTDRMGRLTLLLESGPLVFGVRQRPKRAQSLTRAVNDWLDSKPPKA